jgi:hypothetical protein
MPYLSRYRAADLIRVLPRHGRWRTIRTTAPRDEGNSRGSSLMSREFTARCADRDEPGGNRGGIYVRSVSPHAALHTKEKQRESADPWPVASRGSSSRQPTCNYRSARNGVEGSNDYARILASRFYSLTFRCPVSAGHRNLTEPQRRALHLA